MIICFPVSFPPNKAATAELAVLFGNTAIADETRALEQLFKCCHFFVSALNSQVSLDGHGPDDLPALEDKDYLNEPQLKVC